MDMARAMADYQIDSAKKKLEESDFKLVLVAPRGEDLPDDGFLQYSAAADVAALTSVTDGGVLLFGESESRLLRMLIDFQDEFGVRIKVLDGLPNVTYAPWFSSLVWSQDKVSYAGLLNELSIAHDESERIKERSSSVHDRERKQVEKRNGSVKAQSNFSMAGSVADDSEEGGEEYDA